MELHDLCRLSRPIAADSKGKLLFYLKNGIPSTYTVEEAYNYTHNIEEEPTTFTTPLHLLCQNIPLDYSEEEMDIVSELISTLFEYGAGWNFADANNDTPGCILIKRQLKDTKIYEQLIQAGIRAELLLRKVNDNIEFVSDDEAPELVDVPEELVEAEEVEETKEAEEAEKLDPAEHQETYLQTKLEYKDDALVTSNKDGVMMSWEDNLMQKGCDSICKSSDDLTVLNIGFGMGIIDSMIQQKNPAKHYICEPHPDVLKKLRDDGWYEKPNVVILEGRWQDKLPDLLSKGVFFDGIYYDTYSEHYQDMLELFDLIVGLLKPDGIFSFFNGLGADREFIYEVYKRLVEIDLNNYGLQITYQDVKLPDLNVWDDIKRSYWNCPVYYHPEVKFMDY